jgi:hypothetical protein
MKPKYLNRPPFFEEPSVDYNFFFSENKYASVVWNSITSTDADKLERIQKKFTALCRNRFFFSSRLRL